MVGAAVSGFVFMRTSVSTRVTVLRRSSGRLHETTERPAL